MTCAVELLVYESSLEAFHTAHRTNACATLLIPLVVFIFARGEGVYTDANNQGKKSPPFVQSTNPKIEPSWLSTVPNSVVCLPACAGYCAGDEHEIGNCQRPIFTGASAPISVNLRPNVHGTKRASTRSDDFRAL